MYVLAVVCLVCASIPTVLYLLNLRHYRPAPFPAGGARPAVSILIPARNEEESIGPAVKAALASAEVDIEVLVLDDHSEDRTAEVVAELAALDSRVRLVTGPTLPAGWCGKQHACWVLANEATHPLLLFLDADVRLERLGVARLVAFLEERGAELASGVPRQVTGSFLERLVLPLIHFVLLGLLPMGRMRKTTHPSYAAGCGQLFLAKRESYFAVGGHSSIRTSLHDGITLPTAFREHGYSTDLCDATTLASCRMYSNGSEVWSGLAKNATEGLAKPILLPIMSLFLVFGQVLPLGLAVLAPWGTPESRLAFVTISVLYLPRLLGIWLFRQSVLGAILHPLGVLTLLAIQWGAYLTALRGRPQAWKGREYVGLGESAG